MRLRIPGYGKLRSSLRTMVLERLASTRSSKEVLPMAARYNYTFSGTINWGGKEVSSVVDPESKDFKDKIAWVQKVTGVSAPEFVEYTNVNLDPNAPGSVRGLTLVFSHDSGRKSRLDAFLLSLDPSVSAHELNRELMLNLDPAKIGRYEPPAPPKPAEDWRVEGSPIAGPLREAETKYFRCFKLNAGDEWRSPVSNAVYRAGYLGGFREPGAPAFSVTPALFSAFCAERREG